MGIHRVECPVDFLGAVNHANELLCLGHVICCESQRSEKSIVVSCVRAICKGGEESLGKTVC